MPIVIKDLDRRGDLIVPGFGATDPHLERGLVVDDLDSRDDLIAQVAQLAGERQIELRSKDKYGHCATDKIEQDKEHDKFERQPLSQSQIHQLFVAESIADTMDGGYYAFTFGRIELFTQTRDMPSHGIQ